MKPGQIVLVDTNIMIEAVRAKCWNALGTHFTLETVDKCLEEARGGDRLRPGYVVIDEPTLRKNLTSHPVSDEQLLKLHLACPQSEGIDDGEKHLWAHALSRSDAWIATTADKAAFFAACSLGWRDRMVSLEGLAEAAGARHSLKLLKPQFSKARLEQWGGEFALR